MTWLAAAIFLFALAINVKVTLDDPFVMMSDEAVASSSSQSSNSGVMWVVEYGENIGPQVENSWQCYNNDGGTIEWKGQPVEVICEQPGNSSCPDAAQKIVSSEPCPVCGGNII